MRSILFLKIVKKCLINVHVIKFELCLHHKYVFESNKMSQSNRRIKTLILKSWRKLDGIVTLMVLSLEYIKSFPSLIDHIRLDFCSVSTTFLTTTTTTTKCFAKSLQSLSLLSSQRPALKVSDLKAKSVLIMLMLSSA